MKKLILILLLGSSLISYAGLFNKNNEKDKESTTESIVINSDASYENFMKKGDSAYSNKNYHNSLNFYMEAFKTKENDLQALFGIANSYEKIGQLDKSLGVYRKILKLSPNNLEAQGKYLKLNRINVPKLGFSQKEEYFKKYENHLRKMNYSNSEDIYALGRIYMNNESFERAYNIFRKDKNGDYRNYFGAATTARFLGKYNTSITYYKKLLATKPDFFEGYLGLGNSYKLIGNYNEAIKNMQKYLTYKEDENVYVGIAHIYIAQEKFDEAKNILEEGQNKFPNSNTIRKSLVELYSKVN